MDEPVEEKWNVASPTTEANYNWLGDMLQSFPAPSRTNSSANASASAHSRCNSVVSTDAFSMASLTQSLSTAASSRVPSPELYVDFDDVDFTEAEIFVDPSRSEVVEYECGKVGVLGGAVMLGLPSKQRVQV